MTRPIIEVTNLAKSYQGQQGTVEALADVSFCVERGELVSVVGPSGAGKTTLLQCLSGLLRPTSGRLLLDGAEVDGPPRELALVFQDYSRSLFPWMTARKNVAAPLRGRGLDANAVAERTRQSLAEVGLSGSANRYPWQLSGGMQQRVAIARAIAMRPSVLVMDEPFASVDAQTRFDLEDLLLRVWTESDVTVLFVTHDIDEAVYLSDRVVVLSSSPAHVDTVMDVALERPRDQVRTREGAGFGHLRAELFTRIMAMRGVGSPGADPGPTPSR